MPGTIEDELLKSLHHTPVAFGLFDLKDRLCEANAAFLEPFEARLADGHTWDSLMRRCHRRRHANVPVPSEDIETWINRLRRLHRQPPGRQFDLELGAGRWMWATESLRPDGWLLVHLFDVSQFKATELALRRARDEAVLASLTDPLTRLYNRRLVFDRLGGLMETTRQMRLSLAVAMIDLDHFKSINDRHGHSVGDEVLVHFADLMRRELRPLDVAGRMGGEEFVLLLPNASEDGALQVVDRLRALVVESRPLGNRLPELRYSFSAGVTGALPDDTADELIRRADAALYQAKAQGRDRVVRGSSGGSLAVTH